MDERTLEDMRREQEKAEDGIRPFDLALAGDEMAETISALGPAARTYLRDLRKRANKSEEGWREAEQVASRLTSLAPNRVPPSTLYIVALGILTKED